MEHFSSIYGRRNCLGRHNFTPSGGKGQEELSLASFKTSYFIWYISIGHAHIVLQHMSGHVLLCSHIQLCVLPVHFFPALQVAEAEAKQMFFYSEGETPSAGCCFFASFTQQLIFSQLPISNIAVVRIILFLHIPGYSFTLDCLWIFIPALFQVVENGPLNCNQS